MPELRPGPRLRARDGGVQAAECTRHVPGPVAGNRAHCYSGGAPHGPYQILWGAGLGCRPHYRQYPAGWSAAPFEPSAPIHCVSPPGSTCTAAPLQHLQRQQPTTTATEVCLLPRPTPAAGGYTCTWGLAAPSKTPQQLIAVATTEPARHTREAVLAAHAVLAR